MAFSVLALERLVDFSSGQIGKRRLVHALVGFDRHIDAGLRGIDDPSTACSARAGDLSRGSDGTRGRDLAQATRHRSDPSSAEAWSPGSVVAPANDAPEEATYLAANAGDSVDDALGETKDCLLPEGDSSLDDAPERIEDALKRHQEIAPEVLDSLQGANGEHVDPKLNERKDDVLEGCQR